MAYKEYKKVNFSELEKEILAYWEENNVFEKSVSNREGAPTFTFFEGPPSANGMPGIHHVISRTIKDIFCRYKTLQGFQVKRKAGWDTHGLPVELQVEKRMGITKDDIGTKISIADYNKACREDVMKFKDTWDELTKRIGYWVDMDHPYVTYEKEYIESVWSLLRKLYDKGFLYKGYTVQPYSPAAGTGLSSHELNQPGTYQMVKDTTVVAQFKVKDTENEYFLAWTTTPWTLPSNTALGVGKKINYVKVKTFNQYTFKPITVYLAKDLMGKYFNPKNAELKLADYKEGDKQIPYELVAEMKGGDLIGMRYEQLMPYVQPDNGDAFKVIAGDFVTTEDGTGIVHLAPSFGADDFRTAQQNGIGSLTLVDKHGQFLPEVTDFAGMYVKNYTDEDESDPEYRSTDVKIAIKLKEENKAFKVEKYEHTYPHCWRTDKPILYYPLDSWFIKTTAVKDRLVELNNTINWKPASTGTGRFGNWLENLVDWNLSRSRFWGTPLPIWRTADGTEEICIGSIAELKEEVEKAVAAGFMQNNPVNNEDFDLHRPYVDDVYLVSPSGKKMVRETDLIDVWFDSGAMPYAQWHYPFENEETFKKSFPADFIAEGVDQTRGWFFTLHAIATMLFDEVAYKNVVANGLVLDKSGNKMSKRLGNAIDPFTTVDQYGADAVRWYMLTNASPWDNLKFDLEGVGETQRKFFGTLYNVYSFFSLYANIDKFSYSEKEIPIEQRPEIDRWVLSLLNTLVKEVQENMDDYEPTKATRAIQNFVVEHLSNWYVRLCRRRFWKGEYTEDKIAAYQTLYTCLETVAKLMSSFAPFYAERLFTDLNKATGRYEGSVHLTDYPTYDKEVINESLEERMQIAQDISSLVLSIRKKQSIKVRQPLHKIMVPVLDDHFKEQLQLVEDLILSEVNVKELEYLTEENQVLVKKIKPNFKSLGPKVGAKMKQVAAAITQFGPTEIQEIENSGKLELDLDGETITLTLDDVEIVAQDIPGWEVAVYGKLTVALDITISDELKQEGLAREFVNRVQNLRKEKDFEVTDKINVNLKSNDLLNDTINNYKQYICTEILAENILITDTLGENASDIDVDEITATLTIEKLN